MIWRALSLEDQFCGLAADLVAFRLRVRQEAEGFPGCRAATREELYRRLSSLPPIFGVTESARGRWEVSAERLFLSEFPALRRGDWGR